MDEINPYAAPQHDLPPDAATNDADQKTGPDIWRDGKLLVLRHGAVLPDRCVKCNAPAEGRRKRKSVQWSEPIRFLGFSFYGRREAKVEFGICSRCAWRRQKRVLIVLSLQFLAFLLLFTFAPDDKLLGIASGAGRPLPLSQGIFAAIMVASAIYAMLFVSEPVWIHQADKNWIWLKKIKPAYLAQFPPFTDH